MPKRVLSKPTSPVEVVVGIDASLTNTAICILSNNGIDYSMTCCGSKPHANYLLSRLERFERLSKEIISNLNSIPSRCNPLVFLEGYSFGSKGQAILDIAEFGGILRYELWKEWNLLPTEIPPTTLKLFSTGKGNADKLKVCLSLQKRYGVSFVTNDEFDAYGLARLAGTSIGWWEPENDAQRQAIASLTAEPKKRKKEKLSERIKL